MSNTLGYCYLKKDEIQPGDTDLLEGLQSDLRDKEKSPSKRLRNTLWVLWDQSNGGFENFDNFYVHHMEKMITHFKDKLED